MPKVRGKPDSDKLHIGRQNDLFDDNVMNISWEENWIGVEQVIGSLQSGKSLQKR